MSKYTTEVRFICESLYNNQYEEYPKVSEVIENALPSIFDFNYPIFDENYRVVLETKIIKHFYTREIGLETVGLWKLKLDTKLNEIMPYYNKLYKSELLKFNPLYNVSYKVKGKKQGTESVDSNATDTKETLKTNTQNGNSTSNTDVTTTDSGSSSSNSNGTGWNMYSDTPQGSIQNVENNTYLTNATKETETQQTTGSTSNTNIVDNDTAFQFTQSLNESNNSELNKEQTKNTENVEDYIESVMGYKNTSPVELVMKFRQSLLNIDIMIINELEELFMLLW